MLYSQECRVVLTRTLLLVFPPLSTRHTRKRLFYFLCYSKVISPEFKAYAKQIVVNCKRLANELLKRGYTLVSGGTDNHLILLDLRNQNIDGARVERVLEHTGITVNKNAVPGDLRPFVPGGLRIGTPALTTRGLKEQDMIKVAEFLDRGIKISLELNKDGRNAFYLNLTSTQLMLPRTLRSSSLSARRVLLLWKS